MDLDRLEKLCQEATPGPWEWKIGHSSVSLVGEFIVMSCGGGTEWDQYKGEEPEETDARFIAEARSALPALIARVRKAEKLAGAVKEFEKSCCIEIHEDPLNAWHELTQALAEWEGK